MHVYTSICRYAKLNLLTKTIHLPLLMEWSRSLLTHLILEDKCTCITLDLGQGMRNMEL